MTHDLHGLRLVRRSTAYHLWDAPPLLLCSCLSGRLQRYLASRSEPLSLLRSALLTMAPGYDAVKIAVVRMKLRV
jgi:hypothetical protein